MSERDTAGALAVKAASDYSWKIMSNNKDREKFEAQVRWWAQHVKVQVVETDGKKFTRYEKISPKQRYQILAKHYQEQAEQIDE